MDRIEGKDGSRGRIKKCNITGKGRYGEGGKSRNERKQQVQMGVGSVEEAERVREGKHWR